MRGPGDSPSEAQEHSVDSPTKLSADKIGRSWLEIGQVLRVLEQRLPLSAARSMDGGAQKLYSLARQTRALAETVECRKRADALQALARLYEKQAGELALRELA